MAQTDRHTDGHGNSMTNSAQWGRVGEKHNNNKHNTIKCQLKNNTRHQVLFNIKNQEGQKSFRQAKNNTTELSTIIDKDEDVDKVTKKFMK